MATDVTNGRWETSHRGTGVVFEASSDDGNAEFLISPETLADLAGEQSLNAQQCLDTYQDFADEISEAAGRRLAEKTLAGKGAPTVITSAELQSAKP